MGFLLTATATLATFGIGAEEDSLRRLVAIGIISPIWFVGYLYLAEKRFIILRVAYYLKTRVEPRHPGFDWETWHGDLSQEAATAFHRFDPFYLETVLAAIVVVGNAILVEHLAGWVMTNPVVIALSALAVGFVILSLREVRAYMTCKGLLTEGHSTVDGC
jgi:hypothetical protein